MPAPTPLDIPSVYVGIDAGGSSATVQAVAGDEVVFNSSGGAANALSTPPDVLDRHLDDALDGCPSPSRVAGCFAGIGVERARAVVAGYLARRFPQADVRLAPDYVAALLAGRGRFDVCCVAGTGSVCCSVPRGVLRVSGGRGHLLGDHGSAYRYGQALVSFAIELPAGEMPSLAAEALTDVFGTVDRREIVRIVHTTASPPALLSRLAPALTISADMGEGWAQELVQYEAQAFARTVATHVRRFHSTRRSVRVGLAGGVWGSITVCSNFETALQGILAPKVVIAERLGVDPVVGAVTLARLPHEEVAAFVC